jgi:hypothetical protein
MRASESSRAARRARLRHARDRRGGAAVTFCDERGAGEWRRPPEALREVLPDRVLVGQRGHLVGLRVVHECVLQAMRELVIAPKF